MLSWMSGSCTLLSAVDDDSAVDRQRRQLLVVQKVGVMSFVLETGDTNLWLITKRQ